MASFDEALNKSSFILIKKAKYDNLAEAQKIIVMSKGTVRIYEFRLSETNAPRILTNQTFYHIWQHSRVGKIYIHFRS